MKLSSRMYRQVEIKIRRAIAAETVRSETTPLPDPNAMNVKPRDVGGSPNR